MTILTKKSCSALRRAIAQSPSIPPDVHEIDYLASYVAWGLAAHSGLKESLVLKGANALRKCFFAGARRSKDLDYSTLGLLSLDQLQSAVMSACPDISAALAGRGASALTCLPHVFATPPPVPLAAFDFACRFPWRQEPTIVSVEISLDERLMDLPCRRRLLHGFDERLSANLYTYTMEEIVAEKLRALLQWTRQRVEKGRTSMPAARTYYDLWWLLVRRRPRLKMRKFAALLAGKCAVRQVRFESVDSFFNPALTELATVNWKEQLAGLVSGIPQSAAVLAEGHRAIGALLHKAGPGPK